MREFSGRPDPLGSGARYFNFSLEGLAEPAVQAIMNLRESLIGLGRPCTYYPNLAILIGLKESVFVGNFAYWSGKQDDSEGWIYKTQKDITAETGLSADEQRSARKNLKALKILDEKENRIEHKVFYRINFDVLNSLWNEQTGAFVVGRSPEMGNATSGDGQTQLPGVDKTRTPEPGNPTPGDGQTRSRLYTSSTPSSTPSSTTSSQAERIYDQYPKKVGRPDALRAIAKALKSHSFELLIEKTTCYADARRGEDPQYTPHPATWFNQERYNDPPGTWVSGQQAKPKLAHRSLEGTLQQPLMARLL